MYLFFELEKIPDLSLTKYMSLDESGVDGVLTKNGSFLRQLNRKGLLSRVFFHLIYQYNPKASKGNKLKISLLASGGVDALYHTKELIQHSSISPFYNLISNEACKIISTSIDSNNELHLHIRNYLGFGHTYKFTQEVICRGSFFENKKKGEYFLNERYKDVEFTVRVLGDKLISIDSDFKMQEDGLEPTTFKYTHRSTLSKREFFVQPSVVLPDDNDLKYYKVTKWEVSDTARLYNMLKLMEGLNSPVVFRIDLFAVDYATRLREVLPIKELRNRTNMRATRSSSSITVNRDENAEETLKQYNELIEDYESSPHFRMNIVAFANSKDVSELIVDAAGAEALESGSYTIITLDPDQKEQYPKGGFSAYSDMDRPIDVALPEVVKYLRFMPNLFLLEEVQPFFVLPALFDGEVIELPKETAPTYEENGIKIAVDENGYDVIFPVSLFKKHAFIAGVPGSGKTNTMLHLTSTLWKKHKIPFLIFEPAKQEYRAMAKTAGMEDLLVFSPSSGTLFPLHINPFQFPIGMSLSEHIRNLMAVFEGAFSLAPPAPFMIDYSIEGVYRDKGWYPDTINDGKTLPYPTMQDLYNKLEEEVEKTDYEGEIKGNLKSILQVRIGSLLRREMGDVFNVQKSSIAPEDWLKQPALIELEAMGSGPSNFLSLLLSTLIRETLKITPNAEGKELRHVIFFEEAHNLIGPVASEVTGEDADPKLAATAFVVKMLAEVRALREGIVIADQLPTVMAPEVIKNTGLKVGHRITAEDDRNLLGSTMSANGTQLEQMATFLPGEALITFEGLLRPFKAQFCQWENGTASYDSPSNEELMAVMWNMPGYKKILSCSSAISFEKFEKELDRLEKEAEKVISSNNIITRNLHDVKKFCRDNNIPLEEVYSDNSSTNPLVVKTQDGILAIKKDIDGLFVRIGKIFSDIEELMVKEKGYLIQNKMYQKRTAFAFIRAEELRVKLYSDVKQRYKVAEIRFESFSKEISSWRITNLLKQLFNNS